MALVKVLLNFQQFVHITHFSWIAHNSPNVTNAGPTTEVLVLVALGENAEVLVLMALGQNPEVTFGLIVSLVFPVLK